MGRKAPPLPVEISERQLLEGIVRSGEASVRQVRRAQALLLAADGLSNVEIADRCEVMPATVRRWRVSFRQAGATSVLRTPNGRPCRMARDFVPAENLKLCGLYLGPTERAAAWSDETAAASEEPWRWVYKDHRAQDHRDFLRFLRAIEVHTPADVDIHLVLHNSSSHTCHDVDVWLSNAKRDRFRLYAVDDPGRWAELTREVPHAELDGTARQWVFRPASPSPGLDGEIMSIPERLIVSPANGPFEPSEWVLTQPTPGARIEIGAQLGRVADHEVRSRFSGRFMGLLVLPGERVARGEALAWVRTPSPADQPDPLAT